MKSAFFTFIYIEIYNNYIEYNIFILKPIIIDLRLTACTKINQSMNSQQLKYSQHTNLHTTTEMNCLLGEARMLSLPSLNKKNSVSVHKWRAAIQNKFVCLHFLLLIHLLKLTATRTRTRTHSLH